jgi:hypothetical protein
MEEQNCFACVLKTKIVEGATDILQMNHLDAVTRF